MYPTIAQFQHYLRNLSRMHGQGLWIQKALFEAMSKDSIFDNLAVGDIFIQDEPLTDIQFMTLRNLQRPIIMRARELKGHYENGRDLDRAFYGITEEEQVQDEMRQATRKMIDIDNRLTDMGF